MIKADYSMIAAYYDKGRSLSDQNTTMWLERIKKVSGAEKGTKGLDLGCGTGRFSLPMSNKLGSRVIGVDSSTEMLVRAKQKDSDSKIMWILSDAHTLSFADDSFDMVFMSHLLHHVDNPLSVLKECHRVLTTSGILLIRYGAMDQIRNDVEHTFFPQVTEIDEPRTPTTELTQKWLIDAGFVAVFSEEIVQQTYQTGKDHLKAARMKNTSALSMISEKSFRTGIHRLEAYVAKKPNDDWLLYDKMTLTVGRKRQTTLV